MKWENPDTELRVKCSHAVIRELCKRYTEAYPKHKFTMYLGDFVSGIFINKDGQIMAGRITLSDCLAFYWFDDLHVEDVDPDICDEYLHEIGIDGTIQDYGILWRFPTNRNIMDLVGHFPNDLDLTVGLF